MTEERILFRSNTRDTLCWGKAPGRAKTSALWNPSLWKASPHHDLLTEQLVLPVELCPIILGSHCSTGPHHLCWACVPQSFQAHAPQAHQIAAMTGLCLQAHGALPTCHPQEGPNLPRRHRQTGLDAKGVIAELPRMKFYCSWTGDFLTFFFFWPPFKGLAVCFPI
jgi:hypothetical protein